METTIVLLVVTLATLAIAWLPARKEAVALAAVAVLLTLGHLHGFFPADKAFASISMPVLLILLSIGMFATVFAESGAFERMCRIIAIAARGRQRVLVPGFLLLTYALSSLLPNLTCLYVLLPVMLGALRAVGMGDHALKQSLVALVIASNLGGASTMIGDFPNILISRSQGIPFMDFIYWMMPACLLLLFVLYVLIWRDNNTAKEAPPVALGLLTEMLRQQSQQLRVDLRLFVPACAMFLVMLAGLIFTGWSPFPPELVCLGAACLCIWMLPQPEKWATKVDVASTLFIACLFLFAGGIQATGVLEQLARFVVGLCGQDPYLLSASLIVLAALLTACFSAGPTTAVLIPIAESLKEQLPGHLEWWALSLGVLAGSSTTLLSATAGPIAANLLKRQTGLELSYGDFLQLGWRAGVFFMLGGISYVWTRLHAMGFETALREVVPR
jgi:Na+/H+ antiporter NhaD/arsenite permease-like protein